MLEVLVGLGVGMGILFFAVLVFLALLTEGVPAYFLRAAILIILGAFAIALCYAVGDDILHARVRVPDRTCQQIVDAQCGPFHP